MVENIEPRACSSTPAEIYVGVLAATILFIATNAGLIGVSRLTYSMGQHRQLPESLRRLHPRYRTPYVAIVVFGLIACLTIVPGQADFLGNDLRVRGDALVHVAHVAVIGPAEQPSPTWSARTGYPGRSAGAASTIRCCP